MSSNFAQQALEPISESEQRLRLAIETGRIGLWVWNSTDVANAGDWSPRLKEIFGFSPDVQVTHEMFLERVHPEDRSWVNERVMGALGGENGGHYQAEYRIISARDGSERWVTARGQAFFDGEGKPFRFIGTLMDITAEKRAAQAAEEKLRNSEAYLTEAQKLSMTGSFGWNVSTGALIWSDETYCILECQPNVVPTLDLALQRVHPDDREAVRKSLDQAVLDQTDFDFEHRLLLPSGVIRHVHVRARASQSASGVLEFIGAVMDVTERNRAAEALKASEHVARGQLEALTKTLVALSQESEPEHLLKHVLQMIGDQLGAHSLSV
jgi:PAS domain S-box-containing protein